MPSTRGLDPGDPRRLGEYQLAGRLGAGGQGVVYLAHGPTGPGAPGGQVAIKLLHARLGDDPLARSRFLREVEVARLAAGSGTAAILGADVADGRPYVVSELIPGPSLAGFVQAEGPRGAGILERLAIGTAAALSALHRAGVVHRSLKPANVLLAAEGPRLADFAVAMALEAAGATLEPGAAGPHPAYLAPEQLSGTGGGPAADVFAWGATILFAATGGAPFGEGPASAVVARMAHGPDLPDLAALPDPLREVVGEALALEPGDRPAARQLVDRLLGRHTPLPDLPRDPAAALAPMSAPMSLPVPAGPAAARPADSTAPLPAVVPDTPELVSVPQWEATAVQPAAMRPANPRPANEEVAESWQLPPVPGFEQPSTAPRRRRSNRSLGVLGSLAVGVLAGSAIIVLVLWPQLRDPEDGGAQGTRPAADNQPVTSIPGAFAGTWRGVAVNPQRNASFPLQVTFEAGQTTARAQYPTRGCTTTLTLTRGTGSRLVMRLTPDTACAPRAVTPGNVVVTKRPNGALEYVWTKPGTRLSYRATLRAA